MIVRIATEGQYRVPDDQHERLNQLDNEAVAAVEAGDEDRFHAKFEEMLELIRAGDEISDDDLEGSDVIVPPPDTTFAEAAADFTGEGLIPG
ncbi:MAG TPA: hypothetical protein VK279_00060 [Solirubrobacteraceae bacterium]|nr:hypothetical protein [Solirubrobacteraceae bacterium]